MMAFFVQFLIFGTVTLAFANAAMGGSDLTSLFKFNDNIDLHGNGRRSSGQQRDVNYANLIRASSGYGSFPRTKLSLYGSASTGLGDYSSYRDGYGFGYYGYPYRYRNLNYGGYRLKGTQDTRLGSTSNRGGYGSFPRTKYRLYGPYSSGDLGILGRVRYSGGGYSDNPTVNPESDADVRYPEVNMKDILKRVFKEH